MKESKKNLWCQASEVESWFDHSGPYMPGALMVAYQECFFTASSRGTSGNSPEALYLQGVEISILFLFLLTVLGEGF